MRSFGGRRERGLTLIEVLVGILIVVFLITFLVSASARAGRHDRLMKCRAHLRLLHAAQQTYFAGGSPDVDLRGDSLWNTLADATPPLLEASALKCPVREAETPFACDYLGPARDVTKMEDDGYLACDDPTNHSTKTFQGGHILRKSGEIFMDRRDLWKQATSRETGCVR